MTPAVLAWVRTVLWPHMVEGKKVVEVGAVNVNGSVRPIVEWLSPASYIGVDISPGEGVDRIVDIEKDLLEPADFVISTEMLEHIEDWQFALWNMMVASGEYLLITTRSPGWPYHGYPHDYWRFKPEHLAQAFALWSIVKLGYEDKDRGGVCILAKRRPDTIVSLRQLRQVQAIPIYP